MPNSFLGFPVTRAKFADFAAGVSSLKDRGDPAAADWTDATLTAGGGWHDLDCSAIVPAGAKFIWFRVFVALTATASEGIRLRKRGNANQVNVAVILGQVAGVSIVQDVIVACDIYRKIEYKMTADALDGLGLTIAGWLL